MASESQRKAVNRIYRVSLNSENIPEATRGPFGGGETTRIKTISASSQKEALEKVQALKEVKEAAAKTEDRILVRKDPKTGEVTIVPDGTRTFNLNSGYGSVPSVSGARTSPQIVDRLDKGTLDTFMNETSNEGFVLRNPKSTTINKDAFQIKPKDADEFSKLPSSQSGLSLEEKKANTIFPASFEAKLDDYPLLGKFFGDYELGGSGGFAKTVRSLAGIGTVGGIWQGAASEGKGPLAVGKSAGIGALNLGIKAVNSLGGKMSEIEQPKTDTEIGEASAAALRKSAGMASVAKFSDSGRFDNAINQHAAFNKSDGTDYSAEILEPILGEMYQKMGKEKFFGQDPNGMMKTIQNEYEKDVRERNEGERKTKKTPTKYPKFADFMARVAKGETAMPMPMWAMNDEGQLGVKGSDGKRHLFFITTAQTGEESKTLATEDNMFAPQFRWQAVDPSKKAKEAFVEGNPFEVKKDNPQTSK